LRLWCRPAPHMLRLTIGPGLARISVDIRAERTKERRDGPREDNAGGSRWPRRGHPANAGAAGDRCGRQPAVRRGQAGRPRGRGAGQPATSPRPPYSGGGGERPVGRSPCDTKRSEPLRRRYSAGALPSRGAAPPAVAAERRPRVAGGPGDRPRILRSESAQPGRGARESASDAGELGAQESLRVGRGATGGGVGAPGAQGAENCKIRRKNRKSAQGKTRASSERASRRRRSCGG
jgi:hypothetical protein